MYEDKNIWWGYVHSNGSCQAKRYFDTRDTEEAEESPFAVIVIYPFEAESREEALAYIEKKKKEKAYLFDFKKKGS